MVFIAVKERGLCIFYNFAQSVFIVPGCAVVMLHKNTRCIWATLSKLTTKPCIFRFFMVKIIHFAKIVWYN